MIDTLEVPAMAILKNDIPILEYDPSSLEILKPDHSMEGLRLPEKCVYPFLGSSIDTYAAAHEVVCVEVLHMITKDFPIYVLEHEGEKITLCQAPLGASASAQSLDSLIACGVRKVVCAGSCGALTDLPENEFLVPVKALRDEGTSYKCLSPSRYIDLDDDMIPETGELPHSILH